MLDIDEKYLETLAAKAERESFYNAGKAAAYREIAQYMHKEGWFIASSVGGDEPPIRKKDSSGSTADKE